MAAELHISPLGGRLIEGVSNGFSLKEMRPLFKSDRLTPTTFKDQFRVAYQELGMTPAMVSRPGSRAIGMCLYAGLLEAKDLKRPGTPFRFTMAPSETCAIQYRLGCKTDFGRQGDAELRRLGTCDLAIDKDVPGNIVTPPRKHRVRMDVADFVSAALWGLSADEIVGRGYVPSTTKRALYSEMQRMGVISLPQLAAHYFVNGVVELPAQIMDVNSPIEPIFTEEPTLIQLPLGVALERPVVDTRM